MPTEFSESKVDVYEKAKQAPLTVKSILAICLAIFLLIALVFWGYGRFRILSQSMLPSLTNIVESSEHASKPVII